MILAIDTSTEVCSVALGDTNGVCSERHHIMPRQHAQQVLPMVQEVLLEQGVQLQDLDAIAMGSGPGSFTGVRIAAGVVQGLAYGAGLPVVRVSTLQTIAQGVKRLYGAENILVLQDARMNQVYWGLYSSDEADIVSALIIDTLTDPQEIPFLINTHLQNTPHTPRSPTLDPGPKVALSSPFSALSLRRQGPSPKTPEGQQLHTTGSATTAYPDLCASLQQQYPITHLATAITEEEHKDSALPSFPYAHDMVTIAWHELQQGRAVTPDKALPNYLRDKVTY